VWFLFLFFFCLPGAVAPWPCAAVSEGPGPVGPAGLALVSFSFLKELALVSCEEMVDRN
jgi:hypothetical protein